MLQTLKASPLSNRRSERPAEKATNLRQALWKSAPSAAMGDRFQGRWYLFHYCPQILRMLRLLRGDAFSVIPNNHFPNIEGWSFLFRTHVRTMAALLTGLGAVIVVWLKKMAEEFWGYWLICYICKNCQWLPLSLHLQLPNVENGFALVVRLFFIKVSFIRCWGFHIGCESLKIFLSMHKAFTWRLWGGASYPHKQAHGD